MLQNRVDPFGNIITTKARGAWTGTRGLIHNQKQEIIRSFKHKAWITCLLEFKGRKRTMMSPGLYTELFFLDEATAFAAGHRPCAECRREDFNTFKSCWLRGNPGYSFDMKTSIREIDNVIHEERMDRGYSVKPFIDDIPDGTFFSFDDKPYILYKGKLFLWSPFGYGEDATLTKSDKPVLITPVSIVNTFRAGYSPQIDASLHKL